MSWNIKAEEMVGRMVSAGKLPGAVMGVWREETGVQTAAAGWRDVEAQQPMARDTIFRIASMTKPITALAALMLMEEGKLALDEPITRVAPEFARMRVLKTRNGALEDTEPAQRPITFDDLLTHRSGLTYGPFQSGPIVKAYEILGGDIDSVLTPDAWIEALASLPLVMQPGTTMHYGHSTDLLGLLVARMEGMPLGEVLSRRIFRPLQMKDTGFVVPAEKRDRCAALYGFDAHGKRERKVRAPGGSTMAERPANLAFESGGQGLWSTVDDHLAFARLLLERGNVDGKQLVRPEAIDLMMRNHLTPAQRSTSDVAGSRLFARGHGMGLGLAVCMEPAHAPPMVVGGSEGSVGWAGAFGGWWRADPRERTALVFLTHNLIEVEQFQQMIGFDVYEAITSFQVLAGAR